MFPSDEPQTDGSPREEISDHVGCATIDLDDLLEAQRDERVAALIRFAELEGARVEQEGRKRW